MSGTEVEQRAPSRVRTPVLNDTPTNLIELMQSKPGYWQVIAFGDENKRGVLAQTGHRIRSGISRSFAVDPEIGSWEVNVSTDKAAENRKHPVELFARWIPAGLRGKPNGEDGLVAL